jgi:hypothetical protein
MPNLSLASHSFVAKHQEDGDVVKLFVAPESLGEEGDFSFTVPGELVHFPPIICDCPECGCERAMAGFTSRKATTCFVVRDLDMEPDVYSGLLFDSLRDGGWVDEDSTHDQTWVADWAAEHMRGGALLPAEAPLRFYRDEVSVRTAGRTLM